VMGQRATRTGGRPRERMHDPLTQGQLWVKLHDRSSTSSGRYQLKTAPGGTMLGRTAV
jgi:hypothetical protein